MHLSIPNYFLEYLIMNLFSALIIHSYFAILHFLIIVTYNFEKNLIIHHISNFRLINQFVLLIIVNFYLAFRESIRYFHKNELLNCQKILNHLHFD